MLNDSFGGAVPPQPSDLYFSSVSPATSAALFYAGGDLLSITGDLGNNLQQQFNVTDELSWTIGTHQMKFGVDYRRLAPEVDPQMYEAEYLFFSLPNALANTLPEALINSSKDDIRLAFANWSLFAQDTWKATRTLTLTYGVRWEYDAAPSSPNGTLPFTVTQVNDFATMTLAPPGTPLWHPQKDDFAPRLGIAWEAFPTLVVRAGAGIFYDLGYSTIANGASSFPFAQEKFVLNTSLPLSVAGAAPAPFTTNPPVSLLAVMDPDHVLPRTYEWNAAVEKGFAQADVITLTYVGAAGRKLIRQDYYISPNPDFGEFQLMSNNASSDYNALQAQFRHQFTHGLQTLLSYTWSHSIDNVSSDAYYVNVPPGVPSSDRGPSTFDIRQTLSGAVSYNIPGPAPGIWKAIFGNWSTDAIIYARTAPPVNVISGQDAFNTGLLYGSTGVQRPDLILGVPLWISDPDVAGGKRINPAAFSVPSGPVQGDLGRNALRGFGASQLDFTLRRQFRITERVGLQARADFFNIFNHPNFAPPVNYMTSPLFGQATQMLGTSLGSGGDGGGLNPLYQIGEPRSIQLALKLIF
ncbi:MAG: TonB-dependent receptor [Deltaproteobacteria bacterium]|nr:TonB-dependent receptor [Deltaproteobacteria bacterium]